MPKLQAGDVIAERYIVQELIRRGSVSELWAVQDAVLKRVVGLRIVKQETLNDEAYLARFEREAQIVANLEHPHIVPLHDYGVHQNRPYQVPRLVGSDSLLTWYFKQPKPIPSQRLLRIAQQIASVVDFVHQQGVIHRGISANTFVMDERDQPYLINFTVAIDENYVAPPVSKKYLILSPEERHGDAITPATDRYALGLLLYSLFTGERQPQFDEDYNCISIVRQHRPDLPIGVDAVIQRLLHVDPTQRYASASDAIDDLNRAFYSGQGAITGQVFISYARKDSEYVYHLARELRRIGLSIWIDQDITPGVNWDNSIESALAECATMLLIVSPDAMRSENVQDEWSYFLEEGKPVFPFIYRECDMSFRLRRRQYIIGTSDLLNDVARIVDVLAGGNPTKLDLTE